jgi:hypothetical protein
MSMTARVVFSGFELPSAPMTRSATQAARTSTRSRNWAPGLSDGPAKPSSRPVALTLPVPAKTHRNPHLWAGWSSGVNPLPQEDARRWLRAHFGEPGPHL